MNRSCGITALLVFIMSLASQLLVGQLGPNHSVPAPDIISPPPLLFPESREEPIQTFTETSWPLSFLPSLNAALNGTSALLLLMGYVFIRRKWVRLHKICMSSAFGVSVIFLISYLIYHFQVGSVPFTGHGRIRVLYFAILLSHTVLAVLIVPLVLKTLYRALRGRFDQHVQIARWTFPLWIYVSLSGVVVYWMLYRL